ncbi:MAG: hypothetical protein JXQ73_26000 [Phycisphaerae bacterium]|nr:hypothetical protein [Phycisphaerae bacterium]
MRAIIWKEIRENLKWGVLLMLAVSVGMTLVLYPMSRSGWNGSLLAGNFQKITTYGAAIGAGLLGLLQTVPELLQHQWAFLIHRPLTRKRLFFGKVVAGLALYAGAMLLPFLVAVIWVATPGHIAVPFHWQMLLPTFADVMGGVGFYFAGLLTGIRQARWYGSRVLPFGLPILCEAYVVMATEFWQAMVAAVLCASVLALAAWGSFAASGQYRSQPAGTRAALGVVLLVGILCVGGLGATIVADSLRRQQGVATWEQYGVDKEGRVLHFSVGSYGGRIRSVTDLAGRPVGSYKGEDFNEFTQTVLLQFRGIQTRWPTFFRYSYRHTERCFRFVDMTGQLIWCYDFPERLVVGYDRATNRRIGSIGPDGFSAIGASVGQTFPEGLFPCFGPERHLLAFPSAVYRVDYLGRQVKLLFAAASDQPVVGFGEVRISPGEHPTRFNVVATTSHIHLFSTSLQPVRSFARQYTADEYPNITLAGMPNGGYAIWYYSLRRQGATPAECDHVVMFSANGTVLSQYDVPTVPRVVADPAWQWVPLAWAVPMGGLVVWEAYFVAARRLDDVDGGQEPSDPLRALSGGQARFWAIGGVVLVVGAAVCALVVLGIARRYAFTRRQTWGWAIAGFVLGPAGVLTLLALREWPARIACVSCGCMRVVDQEQCGRCGAAFPPPAPTGTELFDEAGMRATAVGI